jgi:hypothetical protein
MADGPDRRADAGIKRRNCAPIGAVNMRIAVYRRCIAEDQRVNAMGPDDPRRLKFVSSVEKDLAFLERRAQAEGFQI